MSFPFDLPGPEFLLFYVVFSALVIFALRGLRAGFEGGQVPEFDELDPYSLACLRAGPEEALRVAVISLLDRGLLKISAGGVRAEPQAQQFARRPIELAVLRCYAKNGGAEGIYSDEPLAVAKVLQRQLQGQGLLTGTKHWLLRVFLIALGSAILLIVAQVKIDYALARGRFNVEFLQGLRFLAVVLTILALQGGRLTVLGRRTLRDFQALFGQLRDGATQVQPGGGTQDLAFLAGIYGLGFLPDFALAHARQLYPAHLQSQSSSTSSDGGSSSCSSSGSSCSSSSCGGGGGCGGCGS